MEGTGEVPRPGAGAPFKPGEFVLGYPDETGGIPVAAPEVLSRNGSFWRIDGSRNTSACSAITFGARQDPRGQEMLAAKLMGRWQSGAPLVLAPQQDDPALARTRCATTTSATRRWTRMDTPPHSVTYPSPQSA